jgi:hypothetical protein
MLTRFFAFSFLTTASAYASTTLVYDNNNQVAGVHGLSFSDGGFAYTYDVSFVVNSPYNNVYPQGNPPTFFNNPTRASLAADALASAFNSLGVTQLAGVTPFPGIGQTVDIPDFISQFGPYSGPDVYLASGDSQWVTDTFSVGPDTNNPPANWQALAVFTNEVITPVSEGDVPLPLWSYAALASALLALGYSRGRRGRFTCGDRLVATPKRDAGVRPSRLLQPSHLRALRSACRVALACPNARVLASPDLRFDRAIGSRFRIWNCCIR